MLFFRTGENRVPAEKPLGARTSMINKLNPDMTPSPGIEPGLLLVEGECSHHCAIRASPSRIDLSTYLRHLNLNGESVEF